MGLRINLSSSIPPGLYRVVQGPIERGAIVIACLPSSVAAFARSRKYISAGSCPDGNAPVGKAVAALAGDTVELMSRGVTVNGRDLANTSPLYSDRHGRPLPRVAYGRYVVPVGQVWLVSTYSARSFDSRYFGPVTMAALAGRVHPIMTVP